MLWFKQCAQAWVERAPSPMTKSRDWSWLPEAVCLGHGGKLSVKSLTFSHFLWKWTNGFQLPPTWSLPLDPGGALHPSSNYKLALRARHGPLHPTILSNPRSASVILIHLLWLQVLIERWVAWLPRRLIREKNSRQQNWTRQLTSRLLKKQADEQHPQEAYIHCLIASFERWLFSSVIKRTFAFHPPTRPQIWCIMHV